MALGEGDVPPPTQSMINPYKKGDVFVYTLVEVGRERQVIDSIQVGFKSSTCIPNKLKCTMYMYF